MSERIERQDLLMSAERCAAADACAYADEIVSQNGEYDSALERSTAAWQTDTAHVFLRKTIDNTGKAFFNLDEVTADDVRNAYVFAPWTNLVRKNGIGEQDVADENSFAGEIAQLLDTHPFDKELHLPRNNAETKRQFRLHMADLAIMSALESKMITNQAIKIDSYNALHEAAADIAQMVAYEVEPGESYHYSTSKEDILDMIAFRRSHD